MKKLLLSVGLLFALVAQASAGGNGRAGVSVEGSAILSSAYLWRGEQVCGLHFNPDIAFKAGRFCLEQYSFLSTDGSYKEIDWDLSFTAGEFTFHVADYYFHFADDPVPENFFSWKKGSTSHIDEVAAVWQSGSLPLKVAWFTFFWGDWLPRDVPGGDRLSLSSYLELAAWHDFGDYGRGSLTLGTSVFRGPYTGYTKSFMPIHAALSFSRSFDFESFSLPLAFTWMVNPYSKVCAASVSFGISF